MQRWCLQVYWEAVKDIFKDCKKRNLIFTASVTGPSPKQVRTIPIHSIVKVVHLMCCLQAPAHDAGQALQALILGEFPIAEVPDT